MKTDSQQDIYQFISAKLADDPKLVSRRIRLLVFLGYAYFVVIVVLGFASLAAAAWLYTVEHTAACIIPLFFATATLPLIFAFPYHMKEPEGVSVTNAQTPQLYEMVKSVAQELGISAPAEILIMQDFNAFAAQRPVLDFSLRRRRRDYIGIGLPLMLGCTPEQLRCTVAHELGHLQANDGFTSQAVHHVLTLWREVIQRSQKVRIAHIHLAGFAVFYQWYYPLLSAYMITISRSRELEADAASVRVCGPSLCKSTLVNTIVRGRYFHTFISESFRQQAHQLPQPPGGWYTYAAAKLAGDGWQHNVIEVLGSALTEETQMVETHPCLYDRLSAMAKQKETAGDNHCPVTAPGIHQLLLNSVPEERLSAVSDIVVPTVVSPTAAEVLLNSHYGVVAEQLEAAFLARIAPQWQWQHQKSVGIQTCLRRLALKPKSELSNWQVGTLAVNVEFMNGFQQAEQLLRAAANLPDTNPLALLRLGTILLNADQSAGELLLQQAINADVELIESAAPIIAAYYRRHNQLNKAAEIEAFQYRWAKEAIRQRSFWRVVRKSDKVRLAEIPEELVSYIAEDARKFREIVAIIANEKCTPHEQSHWRLQVVVVFHHKVNASSMARICSLLSFSVPFPGRSVVVGCSIEATALLNHLKATGSVIYALEV